MPTVNEQLLRSKFLGALVGTGVGEDRQQRERRTNLGDEAKLKGV